MDDQAFVSPLIAAARLGAEEERVVSGRVLDASPTHLVLCDAFASLHVVASDQRTRGLPDVRPGDLVTVKIAGPSPPRLVEGTLVARPMRSDGEPDWVRLGVHGVGEGLRQRAVALAAVRRYFATEGFLEVETPVLVPSPGLDPHLAAVEADAAFLITSPEYQMKRLVSGGIFRCFQLARCHRRDERGALHNPEFTMLEWYRGFADVEEVMLDTERLVRAVAIALSGAPSFRLPERVIDLSKPFARLTVRDAFERHAGVPEAEMLRLAAGDEDGFFRVLVETVEPALALSSVPVFLCDYPAPQASLARRKPKDSRYAERFELYAAGVELCNGFGELVDAVEQRARLEADQTTRRAAGLPVYPVDERFLAALEHGLPPSAGNALGFDRLVALAYGQADIRRVQAFPAERL